jgi:hypothetical protein
MSDWQEGRNLRRIGCSPFWDDVLKGDGQVSEVRPQD